MGKDYNKVPVKNNMEVGKNADGDQALGENKGDMERPKLQSVVGAAPRRVKRSLLGRLISGILGPEGVSGIGGYVSEEIIKPAIKNIVFDAIKTGAYMAIFGDKAGHIPGRHYGGDPRPRTNYSSQYQPRPTNVSYSREPLVVNQGDPRNNAVARPARYGVDDYIIEERHDAAHVLTALTEFADRYRVVSVAEYYDLINVASNFTDNNYGWRHEAIVTARIVPVRGGYVIKFPPVEVL